MLDGFDFYRYWKATAAVNTAFFVGWTIGGVHGALMQWRGRMRQSCSCCVSCSTAAPCITAGVVTSAQHVTKVWQPSVNGALRLDADAHVLARHRGRTSSRCDARLRRAAIACGLTAQPVGAAAGAVWIIAQHAPCSMRCSMQ